MHARLVLNTALVLLSSPSEDFFLTLQKCWGSFPVAHGRGALNCCAVTRPVVTWPANHFDLWDWQIDPNGLVPASNYILSQTSTILSTFLHLTSLPLRLDPALIPQLPFSSSHASAPCPRPSVKVIKSFLSPLHPHMLCLFSSSALTSVQVCCTVIHTKDQLQQLQHLMCDHYQSELTVVQCVLCWLLDLAPAWLGFFGRVCVCACVC